MGNQIQISTNEEQEYVKEQLVQFNLQHIPVEKKPKQIGFHIKDENEKIIAGINGVLYWGHTCLYIEILWVNELDREQDLGSQLLDHIEQEAKKCGHIYPIWKPWISGKGLLCEAWISVFRCLR